MVVTHKAQRLRGRLFATCSLEHMLDKFAFIEAGPKNGGLDTAAVFIHTRGDFHEDESGDVFFQLFCEHGGKEVDIHTSGRTSIGGRITEVF